MRRETFWTTYLLKLKLLEFGKLAYPTLLNQWCLALETTVSCRSVSFCYIDTENLVTLISDLGLLKMFNAYTGLRKLSSTMGNSKLPPFLLCPDVFHIAKLFWRQLHLSCEEGKAFPDSSVMLLLRKDILYLSCISVSALCCRLRLEL